MHSIQQASNSTRSERGSQPQQASHERQTSGEARQQTYKWLAHATRTSHSYTRSLFETYEKLGAKRPSGRYNSQYERSASLVEKKEIASGGRKQKQAKQEQAKQATTPYSKKFS